MAARKRSYDAVLFDLGGVFTDSPFAAARELGRELGADPTQVMEIVFGPYHEDTDHPWHRLERGELSLEDARAEIIALGKSDGLDVDPMVVLMKLSGGRTRQPMVERVRRLREYGYRTAIVTNNAHEFREAWQAMLPFEDLFDVIVDSCRIGVRKPDPRIFQYALDRLGGVIPRRAVFLDDYEANVRAAEALGMRAILVEENPNEALMALDAIMADGRC